VVVFILSLAVLPATAATEKFHETYEVATGTKLELYNKNGAVTIRGWDKAYVDVYAKKKTNWGGKLDNVKIEVTTENETLVIKTVYLVKNPRVSVSYEIKVPETVTVRQVETSNGAIELEDIQGNVVAETSNGEIEVEDVDGDVKAKTSNGKIEIENVEGYVDAKTSNGSIKITEVSGIVAVQTSNGSIQAEIPEIPEDVHIQTSNGSIELYLASDLNAEIEMETSNGRITIQDIEIIASELSKTSLKGRIGDGGKQLNVKTSNGKIEVYRLE